MRQRDQLTRLLRRLYARYPRYSNGVALLERRVAESRVCERGGEVQGCGGGGGATRGEFVGDGDHVGCAGGG